MKKILLYAQLFVTVFFWAAVSFAATISGHVYQEDGTTPISGVSIDIYTERCHNGHLYGVQTDASGFFEFTGLADEGQFILRADASSSGQSYVTEWYNDVSESDGCENADFVSSGDVISFTLTLGGTISGVVKDNTDDPITDASVEVVAYAGDPCGDARGQGGTCLQQVAAV